MADNAIFSQVGKAILITIETNLLFMQLSIFSLLASNSEFVGQNFADIAHLFNVRSLCKELLDCLMEITISCVLISIWNIGKQTMYVKVASNKRKVAVLKLVICLMELPKFQTTLLLFSFSNFHFPIFCGPYLIAY